jgi:site-specific DNA-methyltransferase (adenine-specific)
MFVSGKVIVGDNRETLKSLADGSVQCVVTSPPYWGLRDYGTATWVGGDETCDHQTARSRGDDIAAGDKQGTSKGSRPNTQWDCVCGAVREDNQIGLESVPDDYVEELCQVFDEVWRVLADDGTLWLNLGDTYSAQRWTGTGKGQPMNKNNDGHRDIAPEKNSGLPDKNLVGIPWKVAFALQARGWYLRQDIIWAKPNPMPEPVTDRCTKSHEYIFLLSKSANYFFDPLGIREPAINGEGESAFRNKRDVWTVTTTRYADAHFATYNPELIRPCILAGTKEGDLVLDPFSGSGTTGEVAMQAGRNYVGLELNPEYAQLSLKRISDAVGMFGEVEVIK